MRITVLDGHPVEGSFGAALAERYAAGAESAGHEVRRVRVRELRFDPVLHQGYKEIQELEPDLLRAQEEIHWCQHLTVVYPTWWGTVPALLKGFFDRAFLPGWAFRYHADDPYWDRLLAGRSARLIVTSDAPTIYNRIAYRNASVHVVRKAILAFCGFKPVRVNAIGAVKNSTAERREKHLAAVERAGREERAPKLKKGS